MTDTCGQKFAVSSPCSNPSQCLANKLRAKTDLLGSTLFKLTWKQRVTPSGRSIPALRASGHRTSGSGSEASQVRQREPGGISDMGNSELHGSSTEREPGRAQDERRMLQSQGPGAVNGFWSDAEWLPCIDGKARAVEPSTFPLAHGATARVGRLRAYGNAIVAPQAAEFIRAAAGSLVGVLHG